MQKLAGITGSTPEPTAYAYCFSPVSNRKRQQAPEIICANFWPADGVERLIRLRERLRTRLQQNAEVVGADELFFEDESGERPLYDLYNGRSGILDDDVDSER